MTYAFVLLALVGILVFTFTQGTFGPVDLQASVDTDGIQARFSEQVRATRNRIRSWVRDTARQELHDAINKTFDDNSDE